MTMVADAEIEGAVASVKVDNAANVEARFTGESRALVALPGCQAV